MFLNFLLNCKMMRPYKITNYIIISLADNKWYINGTSFNWCHQCDKLIKVTSPSLASYQTYFSNANPLQNFYIIFLYDFRQLIYVSLHIALWNILICLSIFFQFHIFLFLFLCCVVLKSINHTLFLTIWFKTDAVFLMELNTKFLRIPIFFCNFLITIVWTL